MSNLELIQILNTAIIKTTEKKLDLSCEERLKKVCKSPTIEALNKAINHLAETQKISRDQAAIMIIESINELRSIWTDYVLMEGIDKLKTHLKQ